MSDNVIEVLDEDCMKNVILDHLNKQNYGTTSETMSMSMSTDFGYNYKVICIQKIG